MAVEGCQCAAGDIGTRWACWLCHDPGAAGSRVVACFGLDAALAYGNAGEHLCIAILPFDFHRSLELSSQKAIKETDMFAKLYNYLQDVRDRQRINIALSKGAAMMHARDIDLTQPSTWEFSGFSQNGEDGILDVLRKQLSSSNRYFVEIGAADGIENNSGWLLVAEKYNGLLIEGSPRLVERAKRTVVGYSIGAEIHNMFVTKESVRDIKALAFYKDPDVFSLDIDGNDYFIAQAILESGFRPKIFVVEYNAVYGLERSMTIEYKSDFIYTQEHPSHLYYGVSISGWKKFFTGHGYRFVTVDRNGVNGFFVDPPYFDKAFLNGVSGLEFAENRWQYMKFRKPSTQQFELIANQRFITI